MPNEKQTITARVKKLFGRTTLILTVCLLLTAGIIFLLFKYTETILTQRLQSRLLAIVSTSAILFEADEIERINDPEDMQTQSFEGIINSLQAIREANESIQYVYVMRRTEDPNTFEFIADADSLTPLDELDVNGNGEVEDDESVPIPGDPYPVEEYPVLRDEAYFHPAVDRELQEDTWGLIMAAYAPIKNDNGDTVAIVGIDVLVDDFTAQTQETLRPFLLFTLFLIFLLTLLTLMLSRVWNERVEALKQIDQQKDELLSIVSHQLATPVSSVKWYLEMMQDGDIGELKPEQKEHVKSMQQIVVSLIDLVQMILDVSRIQLDRIKVQPAELDLDDFFHEIIEVISAKAHEKDVNLELHMPKKLPKAFLDKRLTHMTIENLLSNAVKYTPEKGTVKFHLSMQGKTLHCEVIDTGCGIPKQDQSKIFGKLYRASNVQSIDGNGFGLFIAKGAIEAQGGKIWFESTEGKGTSFSVDLPIGEKK